MNDDFRFIALMASNATDEDVADIQKENVRRYELNEGARDRVSARIEFARRLLVAAKNAVPPKN